MKLLLALVVLIFSPLLVDACQCDRYGVPICANFWESDAVFVGQVRDVTKPTDTKASMATVHFIVNEAFRGVSTPTVDVRTPYGDMCAQTFEKGSQYLIYAGRKGDALYTGFCSRSARLEYATEDLTYIRSAVQGSVKESIGGRIVNVSGEPLTRAKIEVIKGRQTFETKPNDEGYYSLTLDGPGRYKVRFSIPRPVDVAQRFEGKVKTTKTLTTIEYEVLLEKSRCHYRQFDLLTIDLSKHE